MQLLRAPGATQAAFRENHCLHRLSGALRKLVRPVAAGLQPLQAARRVALQVLVAGLTADPKLFAQIGDRKTVRLRKRHKSNDLFHGGYIWPGHCARMCNLSPWTKCHLSRRFEPGSSDGLLLLLRFLNEQTRLVRSVFEEKIHDTFSFREVGRILYAEGDEERACAIGAADDIPTDVGFE